MPRQKTTVPQPAPTDNNDGDLFPYGGNGQVEPAAPPDTPAVDKSPGAADAPPAPDPFDPASLRLSQGFAESLGVKKALLSVPVRKPEKSWWVRVHPDPEYHLETAVIELKEERETYLVAPALRPELATESTFSPRALFTAINRQGVIFLWSIRLPGADARVDEWSRTALEAAERARQGWVRVTANMSLEAYGVYEAAGQLGEPNWPTMPFSDILRIAFKDRLITSLDHPVLRRLRGEV
ncbi:MAG TPA: hypothetical protein VH682_13965 [Gemmataceae bacterium]